MNALMPITCSSPAQTAAKAALMRRVEAASRANEERQDPPRGGAAQSKPAMSTRPPQPVPALAAHILGARDGYTNPNGYSAYERANRLLTLESHALDVTFG
jgi:hypothetical protein